MMLMVMMARGAVDSFALVHCDPSIDADKCFHIMTIKSASFFSQNAQIMLGVYSRKHGMIFF